MQPDKSMEPTTSAPEPQPGFRSRLFIIGMGVTLFAIGQSLVFTIVSPLARSTGLSEVQFGLILTLASLPLVVGAPYWGRKSDRVGRKPVFMVGLVGSAIGTTLVALALQARLSGWITISGLVVALLSARAFYSLTASAIYPSSGGYIADVTDLRSRGQGMAIIGASNSLGAIVGPLMAAALAFVGELVPMYVASALMLIGAAAGLKLLKEPERHVTRETSASLKPTDPRLRPFMLMWLAFFLTFSAVQITTAFYIQDRLGVADHAGVVRIASFALMSMALVITVVQALVLQVFHIRPVILLRLCGPAFMLALATMAMATSTGVLILGFAFLGLSFACATPGINGGASMSVPPAQQGAAAGYLAAANTIGAIFGPLTGTAIYRLGPTAVMMAGIGLFAMMSLYALTIRIPGRSSA
jgi:MFS family permease